MKRTSVMGVVIGGILFLSGCMYYTPKIELGESPKTIKAKVLIEKFVDKSPAEDHERGFLTGQVTQPRFLVGPLDEVVTQAVFHDFRSNFVFDSIRKRDQDADLILTGVIHRFHMAVRDPWYTWVPGLGLLYMLAGGAAYTREGGVDIEVALRLNDQTVISNYRAVVDVPEEGVGIYDGFPRPSDSLDRAFTAAVSQIRENIIKDEIKIMTAVRRK